VPDLEQTKTSQHNEIASLKMRVKKLEKKDRSRTHKLDRLYKGRIDDIDADEEITLVSAAGDKDSTASAATTVSAATTTPAITIDDITLAQALEELKSTKPKQKRDKGKGIMIEHVKPLKKKDQIMLDEDLMKKKDLQDKKLKKNKKPILP
ncbi:hypothetical protein Tco_1469509, partial [Tanacetum coccineum]